MWWKAIIDAISQIFGFAGTVAENKALKIPLQEVAIRERADTQVVRHHRRQDRIQDRDLLKTPKILYYFDDNIEFLKSLGMKDNDRALYWGDKPQILREIRADLAKILTRKQWKLFRRLVEDSDKPYYIIKVHPLTLHVA